LSSDYASPLCDGINGSEFHVVWGWERKKKKKEKKNKKKKKKKKKKTFGHNLRAITMV
jgi:hypothetical protein